MGQWNLNNMKVILTLWTLNYVDCVLFSYKKELCQSHKFKKFNFKKS